MINMMQFIWLNLTTELTDWLSTYEFLHFYLQLLTYTLQLHFSKHAVVF